MLKHTNQTNNVKFGRSGDFVFENVKFATRIVKLLVFYNLTSNWKKYLTAFIVGIFMGIGTLLFVEVTGLYAGGSAALLQGISRLIYVSIAKYIGKKYWINFVYNSLFWGTYFILNILLFVFLYKKLNRQCVIISLIYLVTAQLVGFGLSSIPNIQEFTIFGSTSTVNENLGSYGVQCIIYNPNVWPIIDTSVFPVRYNWNELKINPYMVSDQVKQDVFTLNIVRSFLLVLYGFIFSLVTSFSNAILYIIGGSSAGTEMVALYVSEKKDKDVTVPLKIYQTFFLLAGSIMGSYIAGIIINSYYYSGWQYILNANLVGSFVWIIANSFFLGRLFPSQKIVKVEVFTQNSKEIVKKLKEYNYSNPTTIVSSIGGYTGVKNNILMTVVSLFEVPSLVKIIRKIDDKCLISANLLDDCDGKVTLQKHKRVEAKSKKDVKKNK